MNMNMNMKFLKWLPSAILLAAFAVLPVRAASGPHMTVTVIDNTLHDAWVITGVEELETAAPVVRPALAAAGLATVNPYVVTLAWVNGAGCGVVVNGSTAVCFSNVYSCQGTCGFASSTWTKIASTPNGAQTYVDNAAGAGGSDSYYVTDVATGAGWNGAESGASNVSVVTFPVPAPATLTTTHN